MSRDPHQPWHPPLFGSAVPGMAPPPPPPPPSSAQQSQNGSNIYNYGYGFGVPGQAPRDLNPNDVIPQSSSSATSASIASISALGEPKAKRQKIEWYCDACDLSLDSEKALKSHKKSHVKCTVCSFEGAPKVVKGHFQATHGKFSGSGFKTVTVAIPGCKVQRFKICVGNHPEDVQKWIAERKKKFPRYQQQTKTNVSNEKKDVEEKKGMSSLLAGYGSSSSSEDEKEDTTGKESKASPSQQVSPNSDQEQLTESLNRHRTPLNTKSSRPCRFFMRNGSCLNGDACRFSHDSTLAMNSSRNNLQRNGKKSSSSSSDTLLRKLLANDMRRETTVTLQLLEYIVDCNFMQEQRKPSEGQDVTADE